MPDVGSPCLIAFAFHFERHSVILKRTRECSLEYRHVLIEDGQNLTAKDQKLLLQIHFPLSNSKVI